MTGGGGCVMVQRGFIEERDKEEPRRDEWWVGVGGGRGIKCIKKAAGEKAKSSPTVTSQASHAEMPGLKH